MTLDFIRGDGRCRRGCTGVRAGTVIRIDGAGKRFSGLYYVTRALQQLYAARWLPDPVPVEECMVNAGLSSC